MCVPSLKRKEGRGQGRDIFSGEKTTSWGLAMLGGRRGRRASSSFV